MPDNKEEYYSGENPHKRMRGSESSVDSTKNKLVAEYDLNQDGAVSDREVLRLNEIRDIELRLDKAESQRNMAWFAMCSIVGFTALLFSPFVSDERVQGIAELIGTFYIAMASVVGAYMGFTAWMSRK